MDVFAKFLSIFNQVRAEFQKTDFVHDVSVASEWQTR